MMKRGMILLVFLGFLLCSCGMQGPSVSIRIQPWFHGHRFGGPPPGDPAVGDILFVGSGHWSGSPTGFTYLWEDCDSAGANCSTAAGSPTNTQRYQIVSGDEGSTIRVAVTASYSGHPSATVQSPPTNVVAVSGAAPANTAAPTVSDSTHSGLYEAGDTVTAATGTWSNSPTSYSYQWMDEDTPISGATSSTYTLASSDLDHTVDVVVTATNATGTSSPTPSTSSGVVVNPCDVTTSSWATAAGDINSGHSGQTICLNTATPGGSITTSGTNITGNNAAMTTLEVTPGTTQPTLSDAPSIAANNFRLEGFDLGAGLHDAGSSNVVLTNNYMHDITGGASLWYASTSDFGTGDTLYEYHNRMINVTITSSTDGTDGWGYYGCHNNVVQDYNTFNNMNQHPFEGGSCASEQIIGNEELNLQYDSVTGQHQDCYEIWSGSGVATVEDNRCTPQNPQPDCSASAGGVCGADSLLSGDNTGAYAVKNNLIVDPAGTCMDMHGNGTSNNGANNDDIENNTFVGCGAAGLTMITGTSCGSCGTGVSSGNTVKFNIVDSLNYDNCSAFVASGEASNNSLSFSPTASCSGSGDTTLTPSFTSTEPTDSGATYATSNINSSWGYQVGCTSITVCHGRVGYDAHIPTP